MKKQLAEDMIVFTTPFRERINALLNDEAYLSKVARMGKEKAQESAAKTIREVREIVGFKRFWYPLNFTTSNIKKSCSVLEQDFLILLLAEE